MNCHEDILPIYVAVSLIIIFALLFNAFRGFVIYGALKENRIDKGLSRLAEITEYESDLSKIQHRYGTFLFHLSRIYLMMCIILFNHPYKSLIYVSIPLLVLLRILQFIC
jgi:hypothetical protein